MSNCCGKKIRFSEQIKRILFAYFGHYRKAALNEEVNRRVKICYIRCPFHTWLSKKEYALWIAKNGVSIIRNLQDTSKLPPLPKKEYSIKRKTLYCRLCKCDLLIKAKDKTEHCLIRKW